MKAQQANQLADEELVRQFCSGSQDAFRALYQRYYAKLLYFIMQSTGFDQEQSKDLLQDVFIRFINNKHRFDPERKFSVWIYTISANVCKNALKKKTKEQHLHESLYYLNQCNEQQKTQVTARIRKALSELSHAHRQVFLLRFNFDCSLKEVADILDIPLGTVKSRLHHCLIQLNANQQLSKSIHHEYE